MKKQPGQQTNNSQSRQDRHTGVMRLAHDATSLVVFEGNQRLAKAFPKPGIIPYPREHFVVPLHAALNRGARRSLGSRDTSEVLHKEVRRHRTNAARYLNT